jgi:hypothetical protein
MTISLGYHQYGKAEVRLVHIDRSTAVHQIKDVNVTSQLIDDFAATHYTGDNSAVIATDTQKNTVYALAGSMVSDRSRSSRCAWRATSSTNTHRSTARDRRWKNSPGAGSPHRIPVRTITHSPAAAPRYEPLSSPTTPRTRW